MIRIIGQRSLRRGANRQTIRALRMATRHFSQQIQRDPDQMEWALLHQERLRIERDLNYYKNTHGIVQNIGTGYTSEQMDYSQLFEQKFNILKKNHSNVLSKIDKLAAQLKKKEDALTNTMKSLEPYEQSDSLAYIKSTINSLIKWVKPNTEIKLYEAPVTDLVVFRTEEITEGIETLKENESKFDTLEKDIHGYLVEKQNSYLEKDLNNPNNEEALFDVLFDVAEEMFKLFNNSRDVSTKIWGLFSDLNGSTLGDLMALKELKDAPKNYSTLKAQVKAFNTHQQAFQKAADLTAQLKAVKGMAEALNGMKEGVDYFLKMLRLLLAVYVSCKIMRDKIKQIKEEADQKIEEQETIIANINAKMTKGIEEGKVVSEMAAKAVAIKENTKAQITSLQKLQELQEKINKTLDEKQGDELKQLQKQLVKYEGILVRLEKEMMAIDKRMHQLHDSLATHEATLQQLQENSPTSADMFVIEAKAIQSKIEEILAKVETKAMDLWENPTLEKAVLLQQEIKKMPDQVKDIPVVDPMD